MKKSNIRPKKREGDYQSADFTQNAIERSIQRLNDEINLLASMGYFVLVDTEEISAGNGHYFTQLKPPYFYDKDDE